MVICFVNTPITDQKNHENSIFFITINNPLLAVFYETAAID